jgi:hypothetical protein
MNLPIDEEVYYGEGRYKNRKATISNMNNVLYVDFYDNEILLDYQVCDGHSIHYARSIAENYCIGILNKKGK